MKRSEIPYTDYSGDEANVVWRGARPDDCKCSPGCAHCYVDRVIGRLAAGVWPMETRVFPDKLERLLKKRLTPKDKPYRRGPNSAPLVFVCDTGDLFHPAVPDEFIFRALDGFRERSDITWQLLTKRAARMSETVWAYVNDRGIFTLPRNIWLGVSAENQALLEERGDILFRVPAEVKWLSLEPLLGRIDLEALNLETPAGPHWVVVGGESGAEARPMHPQWARNVRDLCLDYGTPFFFKQFGEWRAASDPLEMAQFSLAADERTVTVEGLCLWRIGRERAGDSLDGRQWHEFPGS